MKSNQIIHETKYKKIILSFYLVRTESWTHGVFNKDTAPSRKGWGGQCLVSGCFGGLYNPTHKILQARKAWLSLATRPRINVFTNALNSLLFFFFFLNDFPKWKIDERKTHNRIAMTLRPQNFPSLRTTEGGAQRDMWTSNSSIFFT